MSKLYNKLVRDNIPAIIVQNGEYPVTRTLSTNEYKIELEKKLHEECLEVCAASTSEDKIEELADVLEIISSFAQLEGKDLTDVIEVAKEKKLKRGGFDKRVYLIRTEDKDS